MAIVVAGHGTVVLRDDGAVVITDRSRASYILDAIIVQAIESLLAERRKESA
jgi:hypothetical protein